MIVDETKKVVWKSELISPIANSEQTYTLPTAVVVHPGWNIGMYFKNTGTIPFDYAGEAGSAYYEGNNTGEPNLGVTLSVAGTTQRYYSLYASGWQFGGDEDKDGVLNGQDQCLGTTEDGLWSSDKGWGTNRWEVRNVNNVFGWYQNKPKNVSGQLHDMAYTYGCNGHQILDILTKGLGENAMLGHYKFGLSSSVLEEFHTNFADGNISGRYFIETVTVPANKSTDTLTAYPLVNRVNYVLKARGTADAGDGITFDARYSIRAISSPTNWTDEVSTYETYGPTLLDLFYKGITPWGDYSPSHDYEVNVVGAGIVEPFKIYDVYYPNNKGNLYVDIYAKL